jgi:hypothetical protein
MCPALLAGGEDSHIGQLQYFVVLGETIENFLHRKKNLLFPPFDDVS